MSYYTRVIAEIRKQQKTDCSVCPRCGRKVNADRYSYAWDYVLICEWCSKHELEMGEMNVRCRYDTSWECFYRNGKYEDLAPDELAELLNNKTQLSPLYEVYEEIKQFGGEDECKELLTELITEKCKKALNWSYDGDELMVAFKAIDGQVRVYVTESPEEGKLYRIRKIYNSHLEE